MKICHSIPCQASSKFMLRNTFHQASNILKPCILDHQTKHTKPYAKPYQAFSHHIHIFFPFCPAAIHHPPCDLAVPREEPVWPPAAASRTTTKHRGPTRRGHPMAIQWSNSQARWVGWNHMAFGSSWRNQDVIWPSEKDVWDGWAGNDVGLMAMALGDDTSWECVQILPIKHLSNTRIFRNIPANQTKVAHGLWIIAIYGMWFCQKLGST